MAVFEELQQMIAEKLSIEPGDIKPESHFIDDLGADSLDLADLVMVIEDKYEVDFSNQRVVILHLCGHQYRVGIPYRVGIRYPNFPCGAAHDSEQSREERAHGKETTDS